MGSEAEEYKSPYGVLNMIGNAWEWTTTILFPYPYDSTDGREAPDALGSRVVRGTRLVTPQGLHLEAYRRHWDVPARSGNFPPVYGFLCVIPMD
ncbi:MAG: SUMF1/EgtB/PvdO family nonheme iron enzyme [Chloroflexi bacterium]|nr:SUMF1/EgtB/PvdO family nonheme iron enzyme [Chloroflexota bacterium]